MSANITLITLCVADVAKATAFYESLGFVKSKRASQDEVSFFRAGGVVLALWCREAQRDDANAGALWNGSTKCRKRSRGRCCYGNGRRFGRAHLEAGIRDLLGRI
jgi:hypothetical protein